MAFLSHGVKALGAIGGLLAAGSFRPARCGDDGGFTDAPPAIAQRAFAAVKRELAQRQAELLASSPETPALLAIDKCAVASKSQIHLISVDGLASGPVRAAALRHNREQMHLHVQRQIACLKASRITVPTSSQNH